MRVARGSTMARVTSPNGFLSTNLYWCAPSSSTLIRQVVLSASTVIRYALSASAQPLKSPERYTAGTPGATSVNSVRVSGGGGGSVDFLAPQPESAAAAASVVRTAIAKASPEASRAKRLAMSIA